MAERLCSSIWRLAEMACIFHRHVRESALSREQASRLHRAFRADVEKGVWILSPITESFLRRLGTAMEKAPAELLLRAGDAVHLVSARDAGFAEIWTSDRRLLAAAAYFDLNGRSVSA